MSLCQHDTMTCSAGTSPGKGVFPIVVPAKAGTQR